MVCARVRAIMHSLTLVHYRYVHVHNHGISKTYKAFVSKIVYNFPYSKLNHSLKYGLFFCLHCDKP